MALYFGYIEKLKNIAFANTSSSPELGAHISLNTLAEYFVVFKSNTEVQLKYILENQARILAVSEKRSPQKVWAEMQENLQQEQDSYLEENFQASGFNRP